MSDITDRLFLAWERGEDMTVPWPTTLLLDARTHIETLEAELAELREGLSVSHIARAVFRALPPPGALPDDWDSGAEIGANNAERVRYTMAASKILAALQEKGE